MMTPKFEDVVEYVRTGEDDPEMEVLLARHPDGAELLKQARFIARMLKRVAEESDRPGIAAKRNVFAARYGGLSQTHEMRASEVSSESLSGVISESWDSFIGDGRRESEDLGTLEFTQEGESVTLSYQPSKATMKLAGKPQPKLGLETYKTEGIEIRGSALRIFLPETVTAGELLPVRLAHGARQMPAVGREMIFMPASGPFVRFEADEEGKVQLPVPEESGTLRIDAGVTQVLHIRRKK